MAINYDLTQKGPEVQEALDNVEALRNQIEHLTTDDVQDTTEGKSQAGVNTDIKSMINSETSRAQSAEANLLQIYRSLTQSDIVPVDARPETGEVNKIYRVSGESSYADWMWDSEWHKLAEYDNAIDDEPIAGSDNITKSGSVYTIDAKCGVDHLTLEQGSYVSSSGEKQTSSNRVRTPNNLVKGANEVRCKGGYVVVSVVEFDDEGNYVNGEVINNIQYTYNGNYNVRYTFGKSNSSNLLPNEDIIEYFYKDSMLWESQRFKLIKLFGIASTAADISTTGWQIGYIWYNTSSKKLRRCVSSTAAGAHSISVDVPFTEGAIYQFNKNLYIWNGVDLVETEDSRVSELSIYNETKTFDADVDSGLRNVSSDTGEFSPTVSPDHYANEVALNGFESSIEVEDGQMFVGNYGYAFLDDDNELIGAVQTTSYDYTIDDVQSYIIQGATKARISMKGDGVIKLIYNYALKDKILSQDNDINNESQRAQSVETELAKVSANNTMKLGTSSLELEQGLYVSSSGAKQSSLKRVRSKYFVAKGYNYVECNQGYVIVNVTEWQDNGTFISGKVLNVNSFEYTGSNNIKYTFSKVNSNADLSPSDNIINNVVNGSYLLNLIRENRYDKRQSVLVGSPRIYTSSSTSSETLITTLDNIYAAYDALVTSYPDFIAKKSDIGMDESDTYPIRHYEFRMQYPKITNDRQGEGTNLWDDETYKYNRILLVSGVHSLEKHAMTALYLAIKELCESSEEWATFIKSNFILDIVPVVNPWGLVNGSSFNVNEVNINRDYNNETPQAETEAMENLISSLLTKGLVGIIDCHNTSVGESYLVANPIYKKYDYYALLTQQLNGALFASFKDIFGSGSHFHLWNANETGQLHWYADQIGVLGCTCETVATKAALAVTKNLAINLINSFGTMNE